MKRWINILVSKRVLNIVFQHLSSVITRFPEREYCLKLYAFRTFLLFSRDPRETLLINTTRIYFPHNFERDTYYPEMRGVTD
jgi:hypothetical protein